MGFVSPATDYVEHRLNLNDVLMPNPGNMMRIETPEGFVLVTVLSRLSLETGSRTSLRITCRLGSFSLWASSLRTARRSTDRGWVVS